MLRCSIPLTLDKPALPVNTAIFQCNNALREFHHSSRLLESETPPARPRHDLIDLCTSLGGKPGTISLLSPNVCGPAWRVTGLAAVHSQPAQGLEPVGNGQAAAGFRAVLTPGVSPAEGDAGAIPNAGAADFVAACLAILRFGFAVFLAVLFLAAFFLADLLNDFAFALFCAALFFFFFFAAFLAFLFFAMNASIKG